MYCYSLHVKSSRASRLTRRPGVSALARLHARTFRPPAVIPCAYLSLHKPPGHLNEALGFFCTLLSFGATMTRLTPSWGSDWSLRPCSCPSYSAFCSGSAIAGGAPLCLHLPYSPALRRTSKSRTRGRSRARRAARATAASQGTRNHTIPTRR
jgi:hypothetical protein